MAREFSNEDGGTQTTALMARWGRTTDIEWVYETRIGVEGETSAIFQGADHKDTRFAGKLEADHPLMFVATVNNNFSALLPKRARLEETERIVARCDVKGDPKNRLELSQVPLASCDLRSINKIFVLNDDYLPGEPLKLSFQPVKIGFGEMVEIYNIDAKR